MVFLQAKNGPDQGRVYNLDQEKSVLGRHPDCDIVIDVGAVSRQHAQIVSEGSDFLIEDLNSRNGTFLNGSEDKIEGRQPLKNGDEIRVCDVSFRFVDERFPSQGESSSSWLAMGQSGGSSNVLISDAEDEGSSTIMSKLSVSTDSHRSQVTATPQVKLQALIEITHALSKTIALDEVLPRVLDSLFEIFLQADRGFVVMKTEHGDLIPMWTKVRREGDSQTIRVSRTIIQEVLTTKQAILSADAASDERFDLSQSVADFRIRSMMCAPLLDGEGHPVGVLQVDTLDQNKRFQGDDLEVLATVALQAGIAIDNAAMHDRALHQKEIERDLELAQNVQQGFLPECPPELDCYEFYDFYRPAQFVGGDYFDYIELPDGRLAIVVADVVGHGIAAALLMAKLSAEVRFSLASESKVADAMNRLNRAIARLELDRFITVVICVLDPATGKLSMANAGHPPPMIRNAAGEVNYVGEAEAGIPVGIDEDFEFDPVEIEMGKGDLLVLWTDGIHEVMDEEDIEFTRERLKEEFVNINSADPALVGRALVDIVMKHQGTRAPNDDMCLVAMARLDHDGQATSGDAKKESTDEDSPNPRRTQPTETIQVKDD